MKAIISLACVLLALSTAAAEESTPLEDGTRIIKVIKTESEDEKDCKIISIDDIADLEDLDAEDGKVIKIITCDNTDGEKKVQTKVITGDLSEAEVEHSIQEAIEGFDIMDPGDLENLEDGTHISVICLKTDEDADECTIEIDGEEITLDLAEDIGKQLEGNLEGNIEVTKDNGFIKIVITQEVEE